MVNFITLEDLLRDEEVYMYLTSRFGDRVPPPPYADIVVEPSTSAKLKDQSESFQYVTIRPLSPTLETVSVAPSPTYSLPSISEDENLCVAESDFICVDTATDAFESDFKAEHFKSEDVSTLANKSVDAPEVFESQDRTLPNTLEAANISPSKCDLPNASFIESSNTSTSIKESACTSRDTDCIKEDITWQFPNVRPGPVFVKLSQDKCRTLLDSCADRKIKFRFVRRIGRGVKLIAATFADHFELLRFLNEKNYRHEVQGKTRSFRAAMRYVPSVITNEQIKEALLAENIPVQEVTREECQVEALRNTHDMVVVTIYANYAGRRIFWDITNPIPKLYDTLDESYSLECERCKLPGHSIVNCSVPPKRLEYLTKWVNYDEILNPRTNNERNAANSTNNEEEEAKRIRVDWCQQKDSLQNLNMANPVKCSLSTQYTESVSQQAQSNIESSSSKSPNECTEDSISSDADTDLFVDTEDTLCVDTQTAVSDSACVYVQSEVVCKNTQTKASGATSTSAQPKASGSDSDDLVSVESQSEVSDCVDAQAKSSQHKASTWTSNDLNCIRSQLGTEGRLGNSLDVVCRFMEHVGIDELSTMMELVDQNKGDTMEIISIAWRYSHLRDRLASFRVNREE